jgi:chromate transporter
MTAKPRGENTPVPAAPRVTAVMQAEGAIEDAGSSAPARERPVPGSLELFRVFFVVGLTAFSVAILQSVRAVVARRGWLSREDVDEGLGLVQLYPGAMMMDLVAYIGYRTNRIRGTLSATAGFILPSLVMVLGLSWLYWSYGTRPGVAHMVLGLDAIVVGVIVNVTLDFAGQHARGRVQAALGLGAFAVGVAGASLLWAVLGALLVGALALGGPESDAGAVVLAEKRAFSWRRVGLSAVPLLVVAGGVASAVVVGGSLAVLAADMAKIGTLAFGNGATILPILRQDVVSAHHWLTPEQFAAGVGFGQATPGPVLMTAAFVGYHVAGWWGGIVGALAIFAPSVAMTTVAAEVYPHLRHLAWVRGAIRGIMAAFVGLLATVTLSLGRLVLPSPAALVLAAAALVAVRVYRWNLLVVFGTGLAAWAIYLALGGPV